MVVWLDGRGEFCGREQPVARGIADADAAIASAGATQAGCGRCPAVAGDGDRERFVPWLGSTLAPPQHTPTVARQPAHSVGLDQVCGWLKYLLDKGTVDLPNL